MWQRRSPERAEEIEGGPEEIERAAAARKTDVVVGVAAGCGGGRGCERAAGVGRWRRVRRRHGGVGAVRRRGEARQ